MLLLSMLFNDFNYKTNPEVINEALKGKVPENLVTLKLRILVQEMLSVEPSSRPDTEDIITRLKPILENIKNEIHSFVEAKCTGLAI